MTNYVIAHVPYGSRRLVEDHDLTGDPVLLAERASEPHLDMLFTADETITFPWSRLCCDVGAYLRGSRTDDLLPKFIDKQRIRLDPSCEQIAAATFLAKQHLLSLCTRIEHANSLMNVIVLDARSFDENVPGSALPNIDICLGFNETEPPMAVTAATTLFRAAGLSVALNRPIQGCLLPRHYLGHSSTIGMTVALNTRLYLGKDLHLSLDKSSVVRMMLGELYGTL